MAPAVGAVPCAASAPRLALRLDRAKSIQMVWKEERLYGADAGAQSAISGVNSRNVARARQEGFVRRRAIFVSWPLERV